MRGGLRLQLQRSVAMGPLGWCLRPALLTFMGWGPAGRRSLTGRTGGFGEMEEVQRVLSHLDASCSKVDRLAAARQVRSVLTHPGRSACA